MLRKLKWQSPGEPLTARYNWCQGPVPGRGPAVEKHCSRLWLHMYPLPGVFGGTCFLYIQGTRTLEMDAVGFSNTLVMNARLYITSQKTMTWPFYITPSHIISYICVTASRATGSRTNAQCAQLKNFNATTQAQKDPSAGIIRDARKVSSSLIREWYNLPSTFDLQGT